MKIIIAGGGGQGPNPPNDFPQQFPPSLATGDHNRTALLHSPDRSTRSSTQKLRPIRGAASRSPFNSNGNLPPPQTQLPPQMVNLALLVEASAAGSQTIQKEKEGEVEKNNLALLVEASAAGYQSTEKKKKKLQKRRKRKKEDDVSMSGGADSLAAGDSPVLVDSGLGAADTDPCGASGGGGGGGVQQADESSSSSESENYGSSAVEEESVNEKRRTRRRRRREKLQKFLPLLVKKVMEKQEEMHRHVIELIERKEWESKMREEAWKQQNIEWMKMDDEKRAQEISRSQALISLIQNLNGRPIEAIKPLTTLTAVETNPQSLTTISSVENNGGKGLNGRRIEAPDPLMTIPVVETNPQPLTTFPTVKDNGGQDPKGCQIEACQPSTGLPAGGTNAQPLTTLPAENKVGKDMSGQRIEPPQPLMTISIVETNPQSFSTIPAVDNNGGKDEVHNVPSQTDMRSYSQHNRQWPEAEVQALIILRTAMEQKPQLWSSKEHGIWSEISARMYRMGYTRSAQMCKQKWESIDKYLKRSIGITVSEWSQNSKTCPFPNELDILYKSGCISPGSASNHTRNRTEVDDGSG